MTQQNGKPVDRTSVEEGKPPPAGRAPNSQQQSLDYPPVPQLQYQQQGPFQRPPGMGPPGLAKACAILHIVAGAISLIYALIVFLYAGMIGLATMGIGCICMVPPAILLVTELMGLIHGAKMLSDPRLPPSTQFAISHICTILTFNMISMILGIIILCFASSQEVKGYYFGNYRI